MLWLDEVKIRIKNKNQILFTKDSEYLQDLIILFQKQNRKTKILDCHAFATEISSKEDIAICHAIGQACAVVHTASHALGYPIYDLTSIIYRLGIHHCIDAVERRKQEYIDKVFYWSEHFAEYSREWADFLNK